MFYSLILSLLLIPSIVATDFPSYDLPCEPVTCGDQLNVTSCVATCCCVWCNSTLQSRQKSNLKGQAVSIGYCIQASYACQADTIMVECARDPQSHTFIIVLISVIGVTLLGWLAWVVFTMTTNMMLCCNQEYTPMPHI